MLMHKRLRITRIERHRIDAFTETTGRDGKSIENEAEAIAPIDRLVQSDRLSSPWGRLPVAPPITALNPRTPRVVPT